MRNYLYNLLGIIMMLAGSTLASRAGNGHPYPHFCYQQNMAFVPVTDSIPDNKKNTADIKEVPKSKKQVIPVAVMPVEIKPVVIKPKIIIKPVIKIH